jgi:hypothetical protein
MQMKNLGTGSAAILHGFSAIRALERLKGVCIQFLPVLLSRLTYRSCVKINMKMCARRNLASGGPVVKAAAGAKANFDITRRTSDLLLFDYQLQCDVLHRMICTVYVCNAMRGPVQHEFRRIF